MEEIVEMEIIIMETIMVDIQITMVDTQTTMVDIQITTADIQQDQHIDQTTMEGIQIMAKVYHKYHWGSIKK